MFVVFVVFLVLLSSTGTGHGSSNVKRALLSLRKYNYFDTLQKSMDRAADPCTDFYRYVCGNWARAIPATTSNFQLVERRIKMKAKRLIEEGPLNPEQPLSTDKVIAGFRHCYRVRTDQRNDIRIVKNFLQDNGVLQATRDRVRSSRNQVEQPMDLLNVLVRLDLKYTLSITHAIRPVIDFRMQDRLIPMFAAGMLLPGWMKAFRNGVSSAASLLGGQKFYTNVVQVQARVQSWMAEPKVTVPEYTTLRDMLFTTSPEVSLPRWLDAINSNAELNLTSHTEVYSFSPVGVHLTDKLVDEYSTRPKPALNWIAMVLFHYLSTASSFTLIESFKRQRPRCSTYMAHVAPYVLAAMLTSKEIGSKQVAIARYMRKKLEATATSMFTWLDTETRRQAVERFKNITVILGVPDHLQTPGELEKHYRYLPRFDSPFVHYYLEALRLKASFALHGYPIDANSSLSHIRALAHSGDVSPSATARYTEYFHMAFIPTTLFLPPFIVPESPAATYGGFGHVLAHEMFHAFDTTSIETSATGTMKMWLSPESKKAYDSKVQCVLQRYASEKLPGSWTYSVKTRDENFADVAGYQAVLAAVMKYRVSFLKGRSPLAGLTNEQLFYVSLCHKWCTANVNPASWKPTSSPRLDHRCNILLNTAKEFQAAFRCPRNKTTLCPLSSQQND